MSSDKLLPFTAPPTNLCILRLSAIGDICHTLPVVRTIQKAWPATKLSWIIGKAEHQLILDIPDINFIIFDKSKGLPAYREIAKTLRHDKFDALLHMQMSLRASLISLLVNTRIKLGFDRKRANDMQWLFTNHKIATQDRQHVVDSFFCFSQALGIDNKDLVWDIPIAKTDYDHAASLIPAAKDYVVISPCSSKAYRNWNVQGYARIADYFAGKYDKHVCITGGTSQIEHRYAQEIMHLANTEQITNLTGKTSLKQLLAVLEKAVCVISPDSGPAHMATAVNTPVIGLYATTNPERARPYLSEAWLVNRYPEAVEARYHKSIADLPWGTRVREAGSMDRITVQDVQTVIDRFMAQNS